jgi:hypothetical protein
MPVASLLRDRFLGATARGRGHMDWSAIGLSVSEDAGVDVSESLALPPKKRKLAAGGAETREVA